MARHQIIYTSCMRGIDGVNDGQQIFSYDADFKDGKADEVKSLFTYQVPALPAGTLMSEEIALTMPVAFSYRLLKNGTASVTLNTYLGRDYMGSAGRFGNHLSHSVVCDFVDFDVYPCELYASTTLRSSMEFEEVNNPNPPAYLSTPDLTTGYIINPDTIVEFLGVSDNLDRYKQMVTAMLRFSDEKKRIIICDESENIVKWIAALHYTLPLEIAKNVNFITYEFDPELSPAQICGVVSEGTRYKCENYIMSNRHFVFDFINHQFTSIDVDNIMMDFFDTAFSFSYESLSDFHAFVMNRTTYRRCDKKYYAAYYLYSLFTEGIVDITIDQFNEIIQFSSEYLSDEMKRELVIKILDERNNINFIENDYALYVFEYLLQSFRILDNSQQSMVKQMIVDRLVFSLFTDEMTEAVFLPFFDNIDSMARSINLSIPAELMVAHNRDTLLKVLTQNAQLWKVLFVVRIISNYVKDIKIAMNELDPNRNIGAIYGGIIDSVYKFGNNNGNLIIESILEGFKDNINYYVEMTFNIEGYLIDLNLGDEEIKHLWTYFYDGVLEWDMVSIEEVNKKLEKYNRYNEMYELFGKQIMNIESFVDVRDYFKSYWNRWFVENAKYGQLYAAIALKDYADIYMRKIDTISNSEQYQFAKEILNKAMNLEITDDYVVVLSEVIFEYIPIGKVNGDNKNLLDKLYTYNCEVIHKPIVGKMLLFVIAMSLNKIRRRDDFTTNIPQIMEVSDNHGAKLESMTETEIKDYFEWAFASIVNIYLLKNNYDSIYSLFVFKESNHESFMKYWCNASYLNSKKAGDYTAFAEFLRFMFEKGSNNDYKLVGKFLHKLNKAKLEEINHEMQNIHFKNDKKSVNAWSKVIEIADNTNSIFDNFSNWGNLFKKK